MKKLMKKITVIGLAAVISTAGAATAFAGQWQQSGGRWWYQEDDGSYPSGTWKWIDGKCYYFDSNGWMLQNTVTPDGSRVGADGAWTNGSEEDRTDAASEYLSILEDSRWRMDQLNENSDEEYNYSQFSLLDINKDGRNELIVYEGYLLGAASECAKVYTYKSGEVVYMGEMDSIGTITYDREQDVLANVYGHNSWMIGGAYKVRSNSIEKFRDEDGYTMVEDVRNLPENQGYFDLVECYVENKPLVAAVENTEENWEAYIYDDITTGFYGTADWY